MNNSINCYYCDLEIKYNRALTMININYTFASNSLANELEIKSECSYKTLQTCINTIYINL